MTTQPDRRQVDWKESAQKLQTRLDAAHLNWIAINEKYDALLAVAGELDGKLEILAHTNVLYSDSKPCYCKVIRLRGQPAKREHTEECAAIREARAKFAALERLLGSGQPAPGAERLRDDWRIEL